MKRALAERAKGDALTPVVSVNAGAGVAPSLSGGPSEQNPDGGVRLPKTPRFHLPMQPERSTSKAFPVLSSDASTDVAPLGRKELPSGKSSSLPVAIPRPFSLPTNNGSPDDADGVDRSYFLQYQNRSLLAEMFRLKHDVSELEEERLARRTQCDMARECVDTIQGLWSSLEQNVAYKVFQENEQPSKGSSSHPGQRFLASETEREHLKRAPPQNGCPGEISTGDGSSVENIAGLLHSLSRLASTSSISPKVQGSMLCSSKSFTDSNGQFSEHTERNRIIAFDGHTATVTDNNYKENSSVVAMNIQITLTGIQHRVSTLQSLILQLLERVGGQLLLDSERGAKLDSSSSCPDYKALMSEVSKFQDRVDACDCQISELSASRDDALKKERRVRRYLFRIMAGQPADEVLRDVELETDDIPVVDYERSAAADGVVRNALGRDTCSSSLATPQGGSSASDGNKTGLGEDNDRYKQHVAEIESRCQARQDRVDELLAERAELQSRISDLLVKGSENAKSSNDNDSKESDDNKGIGTGLMRQKMDEFKRQKLKAEAEVEEWRNRVAIYKGQKEAIQKGMDEQYANFVRRWKEMGSETMANSTESASSLSVEGRMVMGTVEKGEPSKEVRMTTLEHKLQQALKGARRAEAFKQNMSETNNVVECLQKQILEWSDKYQSLLVQHKSGSAGGNGVSNEKVLKDNRKMKGKIDQLRGERDAMNKTNHRLVQQSTEKEEINAEALSTILQLRQRIELHSKEKEEWDRKLKATQQLALAARLAVTAKERVDEEAAKEKESFEKALADRETEVKSLKAKISLLETEIKQSNEEITTINRDLEAARSRCDALSLETNAVIKDKGRALEDLKVTTKRMIDLRKSAARGNHDNEDASSSTTQFTSKQLTTQLEVLKGRLTCPVCNNRDKSCILTRCRHMFCRTCVDTNIKNRSRKCPACGIRFDTKDVAEIWL